MRTIMVTWTPKDANETGIGTYEYPANARFDHTYRDTLSSLAFLLSSYEVPKADEDGYLCTEPNGRTFRILSSSVNAAVACLSLGIEVSPS